LSGLFDWALQQNTNGSFSYRFAEIVEGLCAPFDGRFVVTIEAWIEGGGSDRLDLVIPVFREAPNDFVFQHKDFVLRLFSRAKTYGSEMLRDLQSTLFSSGAFGLRSGIPGEPYPEDLLLRRSAEDVLKKLGRFEPAYDFYHALINHADREIEGQRREASEHEGDED